MLLLGIFIGLGVSICLWLWYSIQFHRYFGRFDYSKRKSLVFGWRYKFSRLKERQQCLEQQLFSLQNLLENAPLGYLQVDEENQLI
ncbi:MAG: histidine kinase, partial [Cyanobacteria bacterium P01_A01_bin.68]